MIRIGSLVEQTRANQMPSVAITDIGNLYGTVKFFNKCVAQGIKPIIGAEVYIENPDKVTQPSILVLLVQNEKGYVNLSELLSKGFREGQTYGKPILEKQWLKGRTDGLICLSGGLRGELANAIMAGRNLHRETLLKDYQSMFEDRFYIEIQRVGRPHEEEYIAAAAELSAKFEVPIVATNDVHFMRKEDFDAHEVKVCINEGRVLNDTRRVKHHTPHQYYKSAQEMIDLFSDIPSAIDNTLVVAQRCNFSSSYLFEPRFVAPN